MARKSRAGVAGALKSAEFGTNTNASAGRRSRSPGSVSDPMRNQNKGRYKGFNTKSKMAKAAKMKAAR